MKHQCGRCGAQLKPKAKKCRFCGAPRDLEQDGDYVAVRPWRGYLGSVTTSLKAGQIIRDPVVAQQLLKVGAPLLRQDEAGQMIQCPHCRVLFALGDAGGADK